ncbi:MAG: stage II sporulation protein M [Cyclobacteriaceae bacterium]|jgi:stage II sporulation protein M|nr:stage II sporulation protein M [Sediminibacterium sp.]
MRFIAIFYACILLWVIGFSFSLNYNKPKYEAQESVVINNYSFAAICSNNLKMVATNISSFVFLGVPALINVFHNGVVLGYYVSNSIDYSTPKLKIIILIIPHAVLELLALILSAIIPVEVGLTIVKSVFNPLNFEDFKMIFVNSVKLALLSFSLIIIAAWVETEITLKLI